MIRINTYGIRMNYDEILNTVVQAVALLTCGYSEKSLYFTDNGTAVAYYPESFH